MDENYYPFSKAFVDVVSFVSGLIGIFGFITGITSLPYMLSDVRQSSTGAITWFGWNIVWYVSLPVFLITLLFVYGVYFFVLVNAYRFLYRMGAIHYPRVKDKRGNVRNYELGNRFTGIFFSAFGLAIGLLLLPAFFDLATIDEVTWTLIFLPGSLIIVPIAGTVFVFLLLLSNSARETALKIEYKIAERH
jgi:hypothetical protein